MGVKLDTTLNIIIDLELIDYNDSIENAKKSILSEFGSLDSKELEVLIKLGIRKTIDEMFKEEGLVSDEKGTIDYDLQAFLYYDLSEYKGDK